MALEEVWWNLYHRSKTVRFAHFLLFLTFDLKSKEKNVWENRQEMAACMWNGHVAVGRSLTQFGPLSTGGRETLLSYVFLIFPLRTPATVFDALVDLSAALLWKIIMLF